LARKGNSPPVLRAGLTLTAAQAAEAVALLVLAPVLLAGLGPESFGVWVAIAAVSAAAGLIDSGVTSAPGRLSARAVARGERERVGALVVTGAAAQLAQSGLLMAAAWLAAPAVADALAGPAQQAEAESALRIAVGAMLVLRLATVFDGALVGLRRVGLLAGIRLARTILYVGLAVPAASDGLEAVFAAQLAAQVAGLLASAAAVRVTLGLPLLRPGALARGELRELVRYGAPRRTATAATVLAQRAGPLAVAPVAGPAAAGEAGIAFIACAGAAMLVTQAATPLTSAFAEAAVAGREELAERYRAAAVATALAAAAVFGSLGAAAPAVVRAWTGEELGDAAGAIRWLAPGFALLCVASVAAIAGQAAGRPGLEGRAAALGAAALVVLAPAGALVGDAPGAAAGTSIALCLWAGAYLRSLRRAGLAAPGARVLAAGTALAALVAVAGDAGFDLGSATRAGALAVAAGQAVVVVAALGAIAIRIGVRRPGARGSSGDAGAGHRYVPGADLG
jgi:O-antigen/teichoic acid export membrane protein